MRSLRRPLVLSFAATGANAVLGVLTGVLLARGLGPTARGELAAVILWPTVIVAVGGTAILEAVTYHAARRTTTAPTLAATVVRLALLLGTAFAIVGVLVVALALSGQQPAVRDNGFLFAAHAVPAMYALGVMYLVNGLGHFAWFHTLRVLVIALHAAGILGLWIAGGLSVTSVTVAYVASSVVVALAAAVALRTVVGRMARFSRQVARDVVAFGARAQLSTFSTVLNERADQLAISVALPPRELGLYVVAWTLTTPASVIGPSIGYAALPGVAARATHEERVLAARRYVGLALVGSALIALPIAVVAPVVIDLIFGSRFGDAVDSARVLLVASVALATGRALGTVLKAVGRPLDAGTADTLGLLVTAVGLAILLPTVGILGAAITSLIAYTTTAAYSLWRAARQLGTSKAWLLVPAPLSRRP